MDRLPMFDRITPTGVAWDDGREVRADAILWATGFRAAIDHLSPLKLRGPGGGVTLDGTRVVADPRVHLVGYGPSASTVGGGYGVSPPISMRGPIIVIQYCWTKGLRSAPV